MKANDVLTLKGTSFMVGVPGLLTCVLEHLYVITLVLDYFTLHIPFWTNIFYNF